MNSTDAGTGGEMHLLEHLGELRKRLIYSALAVSIAAFFAYWAAPAIFNRLTLPFYLHFPAGSLIGTGPAEAFMLKLKVAGFGGLLLALPVLLYQLWAFVAPGLYPDEKKFALPFIACGTALFLAGALFCHKIIFPYAFAFFHSQYVSISINPQIRLSEHLSFVITSIIAFGTVFEIPIVAFLLARAGLVSHESLLHFGRHAVIVIFIISAVLTPPDVFTQLLMAGPLLALYGISIVIAKYAYRAPIAEGSNNKRGDNDITHDQ